MIHDLTFSCCCFICAVQVHIANPLVLLNTESVNVPRWLAKMMITRFEVFTGVLVKIRDLLSMMT